MSRPQLCDNAKVIYGKIMLAAAPMFEKLDSNQQAELVQLIANKLMGRVQGKQMCQADAHILDIDNPRPYHPGDKMSPNQDDFACEDDDDGF